VLDQRELIYLIAVGTGLPLYQVILFRHHSHVLYWYRLYHTLFLSQQNKTNTVTTRLFLSQQNKTKRYDNFHTKHRNKIFTTNTMKTYSKTIVTFHAYTYY